MLFFLQVSVKNLRRDIGMGVMSYVIAVTFVKGNNKILGVLQIMLTCFTPLCVCV